jgi:type I restriction-modification system DNA methylase subunit
VYDPTCGSGSLLLRVKREVKDVDMIYGQEMNRTTYNLARMNMILHDVHFAKFDIKQEDTLTRPQHIDQRFEAVVANPPSQQNGQRTQASYKMNVSAVLVSLRQAQKQIWLLFSTCFINWMSKAQWPLFFRMVCCSVAQVKV